MSVILDNPLFANTTKGSNAREAMRRTDARRLDCDSEQSVAILMSRLVISGRVDNRSYNLRTLSGRVLPPKSNLETPVRILSRAQTFFECPHSLKWAKEKYSPRYCCTVRLSYFLDKRANCVPFI